MVGCVCVAWKVSRKEESFMCRLLICVVTTLSLVLLAVSVSHGAVVNVLVDPGFEESNPINPATGQPAWYGAYWGGTSELWIGTPSDPAHTGLNAWRIAGSGSPYNVVEQHVESIGGEIFSCRAWVRCPDASPENPCTGAVRPRFDVGGPSSRQYDFTLTDTDWHYVGDIDGTNPTGPAPDGTWLAFRVYGQTGRTLYVDDCEVLREERVNVSGTVTFAGGGGVSGATVMFTSAGGATATVKTLGDGTYSVDLPPNVWTVTVSYMGLPSNPPSRQVDNTLGPQAGVDFELVLRGIYGFVTDSEGNGLDGIHIIVVPESGSGLVVYGETELGGVYQVSVAPGRYKVYAEKTALAPTPAVATVDTTSGDAYDVDFVMTSDPTVVVKLIDLDASGLVEGTNISTWANTGILGNAFVNYDANGTLEVQVVGGKKSVVFPGNATNAALMKFADPDTRNNITAPPTITGTDDWTIVYWVNNPSISFCEMIFSWGHNFGSGSASVAYGYEWYGAFYGYYYNAGFAMTPPPGAWHYIAQTYDPSTSTLTIYVDGVVDSTWNLPLNIYSGDPMYIGASTINEACNPWLDPNFMFSGYMTRFQVYAEALSAQQIASLTPPEYKTTIGEVKRMLDGIPVTLYNKPVTLAPYTDAGRTDYFYIEEKDRTAGIRVNADPSLTSGMFYGNVAVVSGVTATDPVTKERYIEANGVSYGGAYYVRAFGTNTRAAQLDRLLVGELVQVGGKIASKSSDGKSFVISDGGADTTVLVEGASKLDDFDVGDFITIRGVVSKKTASENQIIYRDIVSNVWSCGFEVNEGYTLGDANNQQGWTITWQGDYPGSTATISNEQASSGTQSLKLWYPRNCSSTTWWVNCINIRKPLMAPEEPPGGAIQSATFKFKVYRPDVPDLEYPEGSGNVYKALQRESWFFFPEWRWTDFGNDVNEMKMHAILDQTNGPRTWQDAGWPEATGWTEYEITDDYVSHTRSVKVNGLLVETVPMPAEVNGIYGGVNFGAGSGFPYVDGVDYGIPVYFDDLVVTWD